jgi:hypothetical protein
MGGAHLDTLQRQAVLTPHLAAHGISWRRAGLVEQAPIPEQPVERARGPLIHLTIAVEPMLMLEAADDLPGDVLIHLIGAFVLQADGQLMAGAHIVCQDGGAIQHDLQHRLQVGHGATLHVLLQRKGDLVHD